MGLELSQRHCYWAGSVNDLLKNCPTLPFQPIKWWLDSLDRKLAGETFRFIAWILTFHIHSTFLHFLTLREREKNVDLLLHPFMRSLVDSYTCPDWGWNPQPWCTERILHPGPPFRYILIWMHLFLSFPSSSPSPILILPPPSILSFFHHPFLFLSLLVAFTSHFLVRNEGFN